MFDIKVNYDWCKACELCVHFCPKACFEADEQGRPVVVHPETCINCRLCELHCPDFAIEVTESEQEAAHTRQRSHS